MPTPTEWFAEHNLRAVALIGLDRADEALSEVADAPDGVDVRGTRMLAHHAAGDHARADALASEIIAEHGATENWARSADAVLVRILAAVATRSPVEADRIVWALHLADPARAGVRRAAIAVRVACAIERPPTERERSDLTETIELSFAAADSRWSAIDHALAISWARVAEGAAAGVAAHERVPADVVDDPWVTQATDTESAADRRALLRRLTTVIATNELSESPADSRTRERRRNVWTPPYRWTPIIGVVTGLALVAPWWLALIVLLVGAPVTAFALWVRTPRRTGGDDGGLAWLDSRLPSAWRVTAIGLAVTWAPLAVAALPDTALRPVTTVLGCVGVACATVGFGRSTRAQGEWDARDRDPGSPISAPVGADALRAAVAARRAVTVRAMLPAVLGAAVLAAASLFIPRFGPGFGAAVTGLSMVGMILPTLVSRSGRAVSATGGAPGRSRPSQPTVISLAIALSGGLAVAVIGFVHIFTAAH